MRPTPRERGSIFVLALAVLAGLVALLASLAASEHIYVHSQYDKEERVRARRVALSGVQRAMAELANVPAANAGVANAPVASNTTTGNATTTLDQWAQLGQQGNDNFRVGRDTFRMQIVDAASRINLNTAPQALLEKLPLNVDQIESLLDYREAGRTPRANGGKDEYYNNLTESYNAKLRALESVDEVLQVKEWTPETLYFPITNVTSTNPLPQGQDGQVLPLYEMVTTDSYSPQLDPAGQSRVNVNVPNAANRLTGLGFSQVVANQIAARQNWTGIGQIASTGNLSVADQKRVLDFLATSGAPRRAGLININTAPNELLAMVPGITPDIAQAIVQRQAQGFASLGELTSIPGVNAQVLQQAADQLTAISQSFIVRVIGKSGDSTVALEAIVDVAEGRPRLRKIYDVPYTDPTTRWGWNADTNGETVLMERN